MTKSCCGCGVLLQSDDSHALGYVGKNIGDDDILCSRCFRIQHYHDYQMVPKENTDFFPILKEIRKKKCLVVMVLDAFFLPKDLSFFELLTDNPVILVLTKRDLLPRSVKDEKLLKYLDHYHFPFVSRIVISSKKNYQFDELLAKMKKFQLSEQVYIVGFTNAGKSTMLNRLVQDYGSYFSKITTSILPSTTLDTITIPLVEGLTLIDTPGILDETSMIHHVDAAVLEKIMPKGEVKPVTYQIKKQEYFRIEGLLDLAIDPVNFITIYASSALQIDRFRQEQAVQEGFEQLEIVVPPDHDLVVHGFCFIRIGRETVVQVAVPTGVLVYTRPIFIGDANEH